jgi:hypothetical protein
VRRFVDVEHAVAMVVRDRRIVVVPVIVLGVAVRVRVNDPVEVLVEMGVIVRPIRRLGVAHER